MTFNRPLDEIHNYEVGKPIELVVREFGIEPSSIIKLASNENPLGPSQLALNAVKESISNLNLYPDDSAYDLKLALSQHYQISANNLILGSGSDQIIEFCMHVKSYPNSKALMAKTTFAMYEIYAKTFGVETIRTSSDFHNLDEFYSEYQRHKPSMIFLCTPNNPLGECLNKEDVFRFLDRIDSDTLVVIDGAYQEYALYFDDKKGINPKELIEKYSNVIYLGTFSKVYALAGLRIGYGIARDEIINALNKVRPPFNINSLALVAAKESLQDKIYLDKSLQLVKEQMPLYCEFAKSHNIKYLPSFANFITFILDDMADSSKVCKYLLEQGIIIRDLKSYNLNAIRITIGTKSQNERFFEVFSRFLEQL